MKKPKIRPNTTPKPLNRSSKLACVILHGQHPTCKFCSDRFRSSCLPNTWFFLTFDMTSFFLRFGDSSIRLQHTPLNGFLRKMCQKKFRLSKCLFFGGGGSRSLYLIFRPLSSKNRHFEDRFWLLSAYILFLATENLRTLTWSCSHMNYPKSSS